jgi:hypothetical protein
MLIVESKLRWLTAGLLVLMLFFLLQSWQAVLFSRDFYTSIALTTLCFCAFVERRQLCLNWSYYLQKRSERPWIGLMMLLGFILLFGAQVFALMP